MSLPMPTGVDKVELNLTSDDSIRVTLIHFVSGEREDYGDFNTIDAALANVRTLLESMKEYN